MPIILTVMILGLPFVSWYYLDNGLQFRKGLEAETKAKSDFKDAQLAKQLVTSGAELKLLLRNKTTVLGDSDHQKFEDLHAVYDQFKKVTHLFLK